MPVYTVKDPVSGKTLELKGDAPPTEQELEHIFSTVNGLDKASSAGEEPKSLKGLAKNAFTDTGEILAGGAAMVDKVINQIPIGLTNTLADTVSGAPFKDTPLGKETAEFANNMPGMVKEAVRPITDFSDYSYEKPVSQLLNVLPVASASLGVASKAAPVASRTANNISAEFARRSLGFTKRFLNTERKIGNVKEATKVALEQKIITPGAPPEVMLERTRALQERAGQAIGEILQNENRGATKSLSPNAPRQLREQFLFDPEDAIKEIEGLRPRKKGGKVLRGGDYDAQNRVIDETIKTIRAHGARPLPWDEANTLKGKIQGLANFDTTKSKTVNDLRKSVGGVFRESLDEQLERSMASAGRDIRPFKEAKRIYRAAEDIQEGLLNKISSEQGNNKWGLTDVLTAGVGGTVGGGSGAVVAYVAKKVLEKYGVSGSATGLKKVSLILKDAPVLLGQYAPALKKAAAAGGSQFAAANAYLLRTKPEYKQLMGILEEIE